MTSFSRMYKIWYGHHYRSSTSEEIQRAENPCVGGAIVRDTVLSPCLYVTAIGASLNLEEETWPVDPVLIVPVNTYFGHFDQYQRF